MDFEKFFQAVTGHVPYRWQVRIAEQILAGTPPEQICAPTGMGKTAVQVCWLWALAADVRRCRVDLQARRRVALRYVVVVDRRVVVDETAAQAERMRNILRAALDGNDADPAVAAVAEELALLAPDLEELVQVRVLRGGLPQRPETPRHPAAPAIIIGTIDLIGSRLMWRGYGVSTGRRPIDAALIGIDTLFVLDEAHLAVQFRTTLDDLAHDLETPLPGLPTRHVIVMSATPTGTTPPFDWDSETRRNQQVAGRRRRRLAMPVHLEQLSKLDAAQIAAWLTANPSPATCRLVFLNTAKTARDVAKSLAKSHPDHDVVLLVGGMPSIARDAALAKISVFLSGADPTQRAQARPTIICATQTLEVGADLDVDDLVTIVAGVSALMQRLGRLNRIGVRDGGQITILLGASRTPDPVYGRDAAVVAAALTQQPPATVAELEQLLQRPDLAEQPVPVTIAPPHIKRAYQHTAGSIHEPPVGRWLRSPNDQQLQVQLAFRESVDLIADEHALTQHLDHFPPGPDEVWTLSRATFQELWGSNPARCVVLDATGTQPTQILDKAPAFPEANTIHVFGIRPGFLGSHESGIDLIDTLPAPKRLFLLEPIATEDLDIEQVDIEQAGIKDVADGPDAVTADAGQPDATGDADGPAQTVVWEPRILFTADGDVSGWQELVRVDPPTQVEQAQAQQSLAEHQRDVADRVHAWATALRLPADLIDDLTAAALHHDDGKQRDVVQRLFHCTITPEGVIVLNPVGEPLAKSALPRRYHLWARRLVGWPEGLRHEADSAHHLDQLLAAGELPAHDPQLVRHLVLTHHGHFRGLGPLCADVSPYQDPTQPEWQHRATEFDQLTTRYGPYTLALLETLVRLADWYESGAAR